MSCMGRRLTKAQQAQRTRQNKTMALITEGIEKFAQAVKSGDLPSAHPYDRALMIYTALAKGGCLKHGK